MKKTLLTLCIMIFSVSLINAQMKPGRDRNMKPLAQIEEWEKMKLIEVLDLNEDTSVRFFARRNEHQKHVREILHQRDQLAKEIENEIKEGVKIPDPVYREQVNKMVEFEAGMMMERENFIKSLNDILTPEQIAKLTVFEIRFRREVRDRIMERGKNLPPD